MGIDQLTIRINPNGTLVQEDVAQLLKRSGEVIGTSFPHDPSSGPIRLSVRRFESEARAVSGPPASRSTFHP